MSWDLEGLPKFLTEYQDSHSGKALQYQVKNPQVQIYPRRHSE